MIKQNKIFFPNLDGLRFIAFALVFFQHVLWPAIKLIPVGDGFASHLLYSVFCNGNLGVSIFFVLSGFLITYLLLSEIGVTGSVNLGFFYLRRFLRIWPLYYAVLLVAFFLYPLFQSFVGITPSPLASQAGYYVTFLSNFDLIRLEHMNLPGSLMTGVTWSVAVEEQFYLIWPIIFWLVPAKKSVWVFISIILFSLGFRIINHQDPVLTTLHTFGVMGDLAIGGGAAYLAFFLPTLKSWFERMGATLRFSIYLVGISYILSVGYFDLQQWFGFQDRLIQGLFFAWVILDQNFNPIHSWKLSNWKFASRLGKYTYGMYLLHQVSLLFVMNLMAYWGYHPDSFIAYFIRAVLVFLLTCGISYLSYRFFESPFLRLKSKFAFFTKE